MTSGERKTAKREAMDRVRIVEEILRRWDPIGVLPGELAPSDEYDSYAPHIVTLVDKRCSIEQLTRHLETLRTKTIGVEANPGADRATAVEVIRKLRGLHSV